MRLKYCKHGTAIFVSRTIPEAQRSGITSTDHIHYAQENQSLILNTGQNDRAVFLFTVNIGTAELK